ncbi:peptide ABC transporter substrate-binding protein [Leucothrix arctica]|uniref:Peptide ABC transporter substrate-binding protein n=1 Tax=Leucothrix arctica TaxID=1481894 RepID=A0A317C859_9GAMM|nr:peptide ABC transporter substrate-binding protein [Leucothrix arctica]PWQ94487.1 peptide ABC transporter substrate-binding protein [Leucothrix arctica]
MQKLFSRLILPISFLILSFGQAQANTLNIHNGSDPASLDPHKVSGNWEDRIVSDVFEGLVAEDNTGGTIPGQAESWTVSDDGLVYTFKLRDGIVWSDGKPVTAGDFVFGFQRLMNPETAAGYAYIQYLVKNAKAINKGEIKDLNELGVKALDDKTLEITLESPTPYFVGTLAHFTTFPIPKHVVDAKGSEWIKIDNIVTNGPYTPTEWVPGSHVLTSKNDKYYGADKVSIDNVKFFALDDTTAALKRYRAGEFDIMTDFPTDQYEWMQKNLPGQAQVVPSASLYYYSVNTQKAPFDNADVRKALSMGINREVIGPQVLGTGEIAAYSWVPPGLANYTSAQITWKDLPYGEKVAEAKKLLAKAGFTKDKPLKLQLRYNTNDNHKRIAVAIASMWKPIGVQVELYNTETKVHYAEIGQGILDVARAGWGADYNDADVFLKLLRSGTPYNYGRYSNKEYDALVNKANVTSDVAERAKLLQQAEQIALDESASFPIYYTATKNVVSPKIKGFENNPFDIHPSRWLTKED